MNPNDYIFNMVYKGSLSDGACERAAKDCAVMAMSDFKKGKFKKAKDIIPKYIKMSKKL